MASGECGQCEFKFPFYAVSYPSKVIPQVHGANTSSIYYHAGIILLHWHSASWDAIIDSRSALEGHSDLQQPTLSREVCRQNAIRVFRILEIYQGKYLVSLACLPMLQCMVIVAAAIICSVDKDSKAFDGDAALALEELASSIGQYASQFQLAADLHNQLLSCLDCLKRGVSVTQSGALSQHPTFLRAMVQPSRGSFRSQGG